MPQIRAAAAGSAGDCFIKHALAERLGLPFDLEAQLAANVDEAHLAWAKIEGPYILASYRHSGAFDWLLNELSYAEEVQFENRLEGEISGVPVVAYPDLWWRYQNTFHVHDWKLRGYCSARAISPTAGYQRCRDGWDHTTEPPSRGHDKPHKAPRAIEHASTSYADQLTIGALLLSAKLWSGSIHELVCKPPQPLIRVAEYLGPVSFEYQTQLMYRLATAWATIQAMPENEHLEAKARALSQGESAFNAIVRPKFPTKR